MTMAKAIFVLGLCGSGKTHLAEDIKQRNPAIFLKDEGFNIDFEENYQTLVKNLREGKDCIVIEIEFCCREDLRELIEQKLRRDLPEVKIVWKCFENDIEKANKNVLNRKNKADAEGHTEINSRVSKCYTYPKNSEILPIINTNL